ncbi:MAG: hypothetical protein FJ128_06960 [Deltaproteobacteria bacterium]|nr:hypothetical protein [Deltaproteobacteria bacterium]
MITQLKIENFLSLKDIDIEFGLNNIFVGPNMSGKSNIIHALKFLTNISVAGLNSAVISRGGFSELLWKGIDEGRIYFWVRTKIVNETNELTFYEYELALEGSARSGLGIFEIEHETLTRFSGDNAYLLGEFRKGRGKGLHQDGSIAFEQKEVQQKSFLEYSVPGWEGMVAKYFISSWRFYHLFPYTMRRDKSISEQLFLNEWGDNLPEWLLTLQTRYRDEWIRLEQAVRDVLPEIDYVMTPLTQVGTTSVLLKEKLLKRPIGSRQISDGTLQFLALLSLIFAPPDLGAPIFCIEEPENHLHPRLMESLIQLLQQRQQELGNRAAQLFITTHYPYLIDIVSIEELIAVVKSAGATECFRPAEKTYLHDILRKGELTLSDLWYSGALGDK